MTGSTDGESCYARTARVVWRLAGDRVVVRRVGDRSESAEVQVTGSAAAVWLSLDRPLSVSDLLGELIDAGHPDPEAELSLALALLVDHGLVVRDSGEPRRAAVGPCRTEALGKLGRCPPTRR